MWLVAGWLGVNVAFVLVRVVAVRLGYRRAVKRRLKEIRVGGARGSVKGACSPAFIGPRAVADMRARAVPTTAVAGNRVGRAVRLGSVQPASAQRRA